MKRITTIIICAILGTFSAMAARQNEATLRGTILDKTNNEPAGWATVALMTADSTIVAGATCGEDGTYEIKAQAGTYTLTASLIGYVERSQSVTLVAGVNELAPIYLDADAQMLQGATVTERVKLVEMKIDKVVMNVSQSAFAQGSNALELMKKAPGVTIDKDGNVKLNGKSVSVWIDGRPSYMDGKALEALLRSTNSESIEKFELMEHPSSKYDAAGQGGIINIKTKRNLIQGFSGSMGLGGGGMYFKEVDNTPWQESYWLNLAYRTEKTNTFFSIYEGFYNTPLLLVNDFTYEPSAFHQVGRSTLLNFYHNYNVKLGTDWFLNEKNTLGVIAYIPGSYSTFNSKNSTTDLYVGGVQTSAARAKLANTSSAIQHTLNLNYTHVFDEKRSAEITTNLDYYHNMSADRNSQNDTTVVVNAEGNPMFASRKSMDSDQLYDIYSAKADYQTVIGGKYMLESGAKWALSHTDNNSLEQQMGVPDFRSDFIYNENIAAAYVSFAGQLGAKVSVKAGLRGEYTSSFGDWKSSGEKTTRNYFDVFPTAYVGFTPNDKVRLGASYTRRISRPRYEQLNPTKTYVDAKTYTMGNPDILPQYSNEIGLNLGYGQHLSWVLAYNNAYNVVNQIPSYDTDGTQYLTWGNVGKQNIGVAGFNVAALPIGKWLQWTLSANGLYIASTTTEGLAQHCWSGQAYTDFSFALPKNWKLDIDARGTAPMLFGYYRIHGQWESNLAVKKSMLDDRLTVTFKVDDIFRSSSSDIDVYDESRPEAFTALTQRYYGQKVLIDITWSFGKSQKPVKHRNVGNLEEMSRAGGGNGLGK